MQQKEGHGISQGNTGGFSKEQDQLVQGEVFNWLVPDKTGEGSAISSLKRGEREVPRDDRCLGLLYRPAISPRHSSMKLPPRLMQVTKAQSIDRGECYG